MSRNRIIALVVVLVLSIVAGLYIGGVFDNIGKKDEVDVNEEFQKLAIDVSHEELVKRFPGWDAHVCENQFSYKAEERTAATGFSDAVDFPFSGDDYVAEIQELILHSPVYADMVIRGLGELSFSNGETVSSLNPWMDEYVQKSDAGWGIWMEKKDGKIVLTEEYFDYAAKAAVLLDRLVACGEAKDNADWHYCLPFNANDNFIRTEKVSDEDYSDNLPAYIFQFVRKDGEVEFSVGFNKLDKRIEHFSHTVVTEPAPEAIEKAATAAPAAPKKKSSSGSAPASKSSSAGSAPASRSSSSGSAPVTPSSGGSLPSQPSQPSGGGGGGHHGGGGGGSTDGEGSKNPAADPANQGNAPVGGGKNLSPSAGSQKPLDLTDTTTEFYHPKNDDTPSSPSSSSSSSSSGSSSSKTYTREEPKVDSNYEPAPKPATKSSDTHDTPSDNAGTSATNGSFSMD